MTKYAYWTFASHGERGNAYSVDFRTLEEAIAEAMKYKMLGLCSPMRIYKHIVGRGYGDDEQVMSF